MFDNNYLFPFDTGLSHLSHSSHLSHLSHQSHSSQPSHSSHNRPCVSHSHNRLSHSHFPKKFSLYSYTILTIYKRYRKSEGKAKNQRSINI